MNNSCIDNSKNYLSDSYVTPNLTYIKSNFGFSTAVITNLEARNIPYPRLWNKRVQMSSFIHSKFKIHEQKLISTLIYLLTFTLNSYYLRIRTFFWKFIKVQI